MNSLASRLGRFTGEMVALGGVGKVIRVAEGVSVFGMAVEGGVCGLVVAEANDTNRVSGMVFGTGTGAGLASLFCRGGGVLNPLIDRVLNRPPRYSPEWQAIGQQTYRSGLGHPMSEMLAVRPRTLVGRNVSIIEPYQLRNVKIGAELDWWKGASVKVDQLKRANPNPKHFYNAVRKEFTPQQLSEMQIRRTLTYAGFNTYARPAGIGNNVAVGFSKSNGGMIYRLASTMDKQNYVVRVCPGLRKENPVTAIINGDIKNGTLRQQTPYVVQSKGSKKITIHGDWIDTSLPENKGKEFLTHIPLEKYKFKGWE